MLFDIDTSLPDIFRRIQDELIKAEHDTRHPFRFVVLSTVDRAMPFSRYVVLRSVLGGPAIQIFTDSRSGKMKHLTINNQVCLLFFNSATGLQLRVSGSAVAEKDNVEQDWNDVKNRKAYNSVLAPGTPIQHPSEGHQWFNPLTAENFSVLTIHPDQIEVLQLNSDHHLRAHFVRNNNEWAGSWLVP